MEGKVEAVLAENKSSFPADGMRREEEDAMAMASLSSAPPAAIFAFLAPPLSLLRHVACLCAGYLGLDGGLKPSAPAPVSSSSSAAADAACQGDEVEAAVASEDCTEVVLEVRSRGGITRPTKPKPSLTRPTPPSTTPRQSLKGAVGGDHN